MLKVVVYVIQFSMKFMMPFHNMMNGHNVG